MIIKEIISCIESYAPVSFQESYDNSGLITGDPAQEVRSALLCIDVTEAVLDEAVKLRCGLVISHHPLIFRPVRKLSDNSWVSRCLIKAIRNNIALYAAHTNIDSVMQGVNARISEKIGLINTEILVPRKEELRKLVFFVPLSHAEKVRTRVFETGAGHIGNYDQCSFNIHGEGTFRGSENTNPFVGTRGKFHTEKEVRVETIYPVYMEHAVIKAMLDEHPYEEVAYDIYPLANLYTRAGSGMTGELPGPVSETAFLRKLRQVFRCGTIRHSPLTGKKIKRVAVCGGSGGQFLDQAIGIDADGRIIIADIGHYESEQFTTEIFHELILKKFPKFAVHFSEVNTNPVNYY
jgi:dinuclear metal center YbgI/SA1388 family protein